ncbi:hypothetical protein BCR39DRAFT_514053 [Naematelia encephala]|uniref:Small ribosomal subunit protein mS33 n=1 Tax=Naematelia encephala TaxID=71784 RepID=A0A1Y2BIT7_9TREE|nr:hypothetical protein BCR39DRAFT_514053 [Naematelia encephala]
MPPPSTPQALHNLLSSLRAPIFNTHHNPTNARLGTKHLRRPLRSLARLDWYPAPLNYRRLNGLTPFNNYFAKIPGLSSIQGKGWGNEPVDRDRSTSIQNPFRGDGGEDETTIPRVHGAGWLWDEKEDYRIQYNLRRAKVGKVKPKKGFGRRSQMGKGKTGKK